MVRRARAVLCLLGELGKAAHFSYGDFWMKKRWRFMATVNEVTLMENREGDLRQNFRHLLFL